MDRFYGIELTGKLFNEVFPNIILYKFTNIEEIHHGFQYKDGLNVDTREFDISKGECSPGGLYFTSFHHICYWIYGYEYVRNVTIPDDARICIYKTKFKANKIIVGSRIKINESDILQNIEVQRLAVQQNGRVIQYIKEPSEEVQRLAVQQNGHVIQYIKEPSEEVQTLALLYECCYNIRFIEITNKDMYQIDIQDKFIIEYIKNPSEKLQKIAVQQNGYAICKIKNPSEEVQRLAVQQNGRVIQYITEPSEEVQKLAVEQNCYAIEYIKNPSEEVQRLAVERIACIAEFTKNTIEEMKQLEEY